MSLRERLAEQEANQARKQIAPVLQDLERATDMLRRSALCAERLIHCLRWQRSAIFMTAAVVLMAAFLTALPSHWWLSSAEQRQLALGQRLEQKWGTLGDTERDRLQELLGMPEDP